jgi:type I restriction enzyme, S subunit
VNGPEWTTVPIKTLYEGLYDGPHATPKPAGSGPVFLGIKNVTEDGHLDLSEIRHIAEDDYPAWTRRVEPRAGDLVFTYEATLNRYAIIPAGFRGCLGRRMALIRPNPEKLDVRFLLYYFFSDAWRAVITQNMLAGATVDRIPLTNFPEFPVRVPPLAEQRRIAGVLAAYDDLIENNQRRIQILEQLARAVYREWFAECRFPGHKKVRLVKSPLGPIPDGWEVRLVKQILSRHPSGTIYTESSVSPQGSTLVLDQSTSELLGFHDNEPDHRASPEAPIAIFGDHTCKMQLLVEPFSIGPNVVPFTAGGQLPTAYVFYAVNSLIQTQEYKRHWSPLCAKEVIVADERTARRYSELIRPMLLEQELLRRSNRKLRRSRDLLLPRLLSGQITLDATAAA